MFKKLFGRKRKSADFSSAMMRDVMRRLDGTPDNSASGNAIRDTETVMHGAMEIIPGELLNRNEATKATSKYFMTGVALAYCLHHGIDQSDTRTVEVVVRCSLRHWTSGRAADHIADCLGSYLTDEDWSGPVIDQAMEAVGTEGHQPAEIAGVLKKALERWCAFDTDAYYEKQKRLALAATR